MMWRPHLHPYSVITLTVYSRNQRPWAFLWSKLSNSSGLPKQFVSLARSLRLFFCPHRSITVPYAYQCCAFVACDSAVNPAEEDERRNAFGMSFLVYSIMLLSSGACCFWCMWPHVIEWGGLVVFMCDIMILIVDMHINIFVRWWGGDGKDSSSHALLTLTR